MNNDLLILAFLLIFVCVFVPRIMSNYRTDSVTHEDHWGNYFSTMVDLVIELTNENDELKEKLGMKPLYLGWIPDDVLLQFDTLEEAEQWVVEERRKGNDAESITFNADKQ